MFGCCFGLYGSKILKSFHFVTFWFDKWSAPRYYIRFSQSKKKKEIPQTRLQSPFSFWNVQTLGYDLCNIKIQCYHILRLVYVNFSFQRRCLQLLIFIILCKTKWITTSVHWMMSRIELVTLMIETKLLTTEPLRQCCD